MCWRTTSWDDVDHFRGRRSNYRTTKLLRLSSAEENEDQPSSWLMTLILNEKHYAMFSLLFKSLGENGVGACGTLRINRTGTPEQIKKAKMKKGDPLLSVTDDKVLFLSWFDKRQVNIMSTVHKAMTFTMRVRARGQCEPREVQKPVPNECYTKYMGGADHADQGMWYNLNIHKTLKWWKKVFVYLLEVSYINSWIVWKSMHPGTRQYPEKFCLTIVHGLLDGYVRQGGRPWRRTGDAPSRLTERHFLAVNRDLTPAGRPSKPDCVVCSSRAVRRHQTYLVCIHCEKPMCAAPCFQHFHNLVEYKVDCVPGYHKWSSGQILYLCFIFIDVNHIC